MFLKPFERGAPSSEPRCHPGLQTLRPATAPLRIAVIGDGIVGAVAVIRLLEASARPLAITRLRGGVAARDAEDPALPHASRDLSLYPEAPLHFARWLKAFARHRGWKVPPGIGWADFHPPRSYFADYVGMRLACGLHDYADQVRLVARDAGVSGIGMLGAECVIALDGSTPLLCDAVILAGPPGPALLDALLSRGLARRRAPGAALEIEAETQALVTAAGRSSARIFAVTATDIPDLVAEARTLAASVTAVVVPVRAVAGPRPTSR